MKRLYTPQVLCLLLFQLALALVFSSNAAHAKSMLQLQDMHALATVSEPDFSPDGRTLVYTVDTPNMATDTSSSDLFTVDFAKRRQQAFTSTPESSEWAARYTSDGRHIVFLSDRGEQETTQVWMQPVSGGAAVNLSQWPDDIEDYSLSPDGKYLAYVSITAKKDASEASEDTTPPPIVTERFYFKEDYSGYLDEQRSSIFVRSLADGRTVVVGKTDRNTWLPSWSPDSTQLAYVEKSGEQADQHFNYDVFVQRIARQADAQAIPYELPAPRQISHFSGIDADPYWMVRPQWSPNGRQLVWLQGEESKWIYYAPMQLALANLDNGNVRKLAWQDRWMNQPLWSEDGKSIFAIVEENREAHVQQINVASGSISYLSAGPQFISAIALGKQDRLVALSSNDQQPAELYALEGARQRQLTAHNEWLGEKNILPAENITFDNDGVTVHGFITRPLGEKPAAGYPTVVELHGGPVYQFSREFSVDRQLYANNGYLVVSINPRGSSGKGFDFARAIYADWGNKDSSDILVGLNDLQAKGLVDPDRIGLEGWSYGGMLTHYLIARDTRFKAAVSGAGATNVFATFGHDMYIREYLYELGTPWENMDAYQRVSQPFLQANKIKTPTLFQCTQWDFSVPCIGAEQMFQSLKILNIPTRLVIYPDQYHGLEIPSYIEDRMQRNLNWFKRFLRNGDSEAARLKASASTPTPNAP